MRAVSWKRYKNTTENLANTSFNLWRQDETSQNAYERDVLIQGYLQQDYTRDKIGNKHNTNYKTLISANIIIRQEEINMRLC